MHMYVDKGRVKFCWICVDVINGCVLMHAVRTASVKVSPWSRSKPHLSRVTDCVTVSCRSRKVMRTWIVDGCCVFCLCVMLPWKWSICSGLRDRVGLADRGKWCVCESLMDAGCRCWKPDFWSSSGITEVRSSLLPAARGVYMAPLPVTSMWVLCFTDCD